MRWMQRDRHSSSLGAGVLVACGWLAAGAYSQSPALTHSSGTTGAQTSADCESCHLCDRPTATTACLRPCTRPSAVDMIDALRAKRSPDLVILDELEDRFLPVPFDHRGHAEMADMTRGCEVCHHYTPAGAEHPACRTCHEITPRREDIRKPGLKGAYHRQCLNCHREWTGTKRCEMCHHRKTGTGDDVASPPVPTKDDLIGQMHPPIPEPDVEIYSTSGRESPAAKVIFRHREHIHRFGLSCAECHHEDNCMRCHEEGKTHVQRVKTLDEHHKPCFDCHKDADCDRCHWEEGRPKPAPFDHADTGWMLGRYHDKLICRACHLTVPFSARERSCDACHSEWSPAGFDHAVTGQSLDKTHMNFDCEECHLERRFELAPACDECHDEDEGIRFPVRRPGPFAAVAPLAELLSLERRSGRDCGETP